MTETKAGGERERGRKRAIDRICKHVSVQRLRRSLHVSGFHVNAIKPLSDPENIHPLGDKTLPESWQKII